ncbi:MAG: hypothetical protein ACRELV_12015 [Longimicrobiales bacterium]
MDEQQQGRQDRAREGMSAWAGVLDAFREAIEETVEELRQRSDISPERAKDAMRTGMRRAETAFSEARERLDFVPRKEFEALRSEVEALRRRLDATSGGSGPPPQIPVESG